ncbi:MULTISPECIES: methyl-accepting chemotaxis protein [Pseudomonas]|uniref:methyl-accepting chemotaxis protein n=1 Tax=Pseudomonas TaxID=286 RepID=UPI00123AD711|nr:MULTISPECIES: methyl-accepting chemotaxis protein [Pseudomonas]MBA1248628.1 HAMP domain-containing protein [Pseudomonas zeshuii]QEU27826.1 HAMP domain-containing protein [Pseudomonas luteola]
MLSNLSIAKKLGAGFGLIIAIICILVYVARHGFTEVDNSVKWNIHTYQTIDGANNLLISLTNIETGMRGFALSGQDDFLEPYNAGKTAFEQTWTKLKNLTSDNPTQQTRLDELKATQMKWLSEDIERSIQLRRAVVQGASSMDDMVQRIIDRQDKAKMDKMRKIIADFSNDESKLLGVRNEAMQSAEQVAIWTLIGGGILAALAAIVIAFSLSVSIKRRLNDAIQVAQAIAAGRLDTQIRSTGEDEIGSLLKAFNAMQQRLREMISEIKGGAEQLLTAARDISNTSEQLAVAARDQSSSASSMAATVEELTVSISHVSTSANEAHGISTDSGKRSIQGGNVIKQTLDSMTQIAGTVQSSAEQISELDRHADQITSIVNVISEIAEQTNLLALNAAIEAARAGDQGRGFAVVADEVRLLAQRTGKSTQEIADMIKKIQASTQDAVSSMNVGVTQVNQGVELAHSASQAIDEIRSGSDRIISVVDQISMALREQSAASQDVARSVERIAQMAETNSHSIESASRNASSIQHLAQSLDKQVAQFRL